MQGKTLAERYLVICKGCNQNPNPNLLSKLSNLKFSEGEVVASDCELDDISVLPLLKAIDEDGIFSLLDFSHNHLGRHFARTIQETIAASKIKDLGLTLDVHNNSRMGGTVLFQIFDCPVSLSRLQVLNLSGNQLLDHYGRILGTFVKNCKGLQILNLQSCSIGTPTIKRIGEALPLESGLVKLSIGKNNPIGGYGMTILLNKLSKLKSFSDLDITDVLLDNNSIESLCHLLQSSSSISALAIGGTRIGVDRALELSGSLAMRTTITMLDMSFCVFDPHGGSKLCQDFILHGLVQLNLSGNQLEERGAHVLAHLLAEARCHLKILMINKCDLGKNGILKIIQALSNNSSLQDLGLSGNITTETGADRCGAESYVQGVVSTLNYHVECSDNRASDCSKQHDSPTSTECTSILHCVSSNRYNNGEKDQECQSLPTGLKTNPSKTRASVGDTSENTKKRRLSCSCQQCESCDEEEGRPNGVNCSSLQSDCASSPQPFGLTRDRYDLLLDLHTNENVDNATYKISYGAYASELFIAIQMAKNLRMLDLSDNSLPSDMAEQLYVAWSLNRRAGNPAKHIDNPVVHFSVEGRQCCGVRPCCRRLI